MPNAARAISLVLAAGLLAGCSARPEPRVVSPRVLSGLPVSVTVTSFPGEVEDLAVRSASAIRPGWTKKTWLPRSYVRRTALQGRAACVVGFGRTVPDEATALPKASTARLLPDEAYRMVMSVSYAGRRWRVVVPVRPQSKAGQTTWRLGSETLTDLGPEPGGTP